MQLRSNILLKFFALTLFTVEFLAPAVVTGITTTKEVQEKTSFVNSSHLQNPFLFVFFEELCENEEGKEFENNSTLSDAEFFSLSTYQYLFESRQEVTLASWQVSAQYNMHPPLFLVHRKLLI